MGGTGGSDLKRESAKGSSVVTASFEASSGILPGQESCTYRLRLGHPSPPHSPHVAVNKADIIDRIATGTGLTKIETEAVVNGFMTTVMQALEAGEHIELRGFGTFRVQHRAARTARNPRTNEVVQVPDQYVPQFRPSREFRERVDTAWQERGDDR